MDGWMYALSESCTISLMQYFLRSQTFDPPAGHKATLYVYDPTIYVVGKLFGKVRCDHRTQEDLRSIRRPVQDF